MPINNKGKIWEFHPLDIPFFFFFLNVPRSSRQLDPWSCFPFIRSGHNHLARHSEKGKKTRQTEEEVRRHQEMDRPGVRQVPESSVEQRKMEETGL